MYIAEANPPHKAGDFILERRDSLLEIREVPAQQLQLLYKPDLFIFDMDGLMFDTERISVPCWRAAGKKYGITLSDSFFDRIFGMNDRQIKEVFLQTFGRDFPYEAMHTEKAAAQLAIYEQSGAPLEPGLRECLDYAKTAGIACAIASSSSENTVRMLLEKAGLTAYFCLIQSGAELAHSKPAPDIFQRVCAQLHVMPAAALVFEDSANGLLAARAAGIPAIWVPDLVRVPAAVAASAWHTCQTLGEVPALIERLQEKRGERYSNGKN